MATENIRGDLLIIDSREFQTRPILLVFVNMLIKAVRNAKNWISSSLLSSLFSRMLELNHLLFTAVIYKDGLDKKLENSLSPTFQLLRIGFFVLKDEIALFLGKSPNLLPNIP